MKAALILAFLFCTMGAAAQTDTSEPVSDTVGGRAFLIQKVERDGVVMPEIEIKEVAIIPRPGEARKSEYRKYERLIYNLKKVYPYALVVRLKLGQVNHKLSQLENERERKEYIKQFEKDVFSEFQDDISHLTITQGKLLIKLIDRETQNTSFDLIKEYRGKFSAALWQGIARIFGTNLKEEYDPLGEDVLIEAIIREIDAGRL